MQQPLTHTEFDLQAYVPAFFETPHCRHIKKVLFQEKKINTAAASIFVKKLYGAKRENHQRNKICF